MRSVSAVTIALNVLIIKIRGDDYLEGAIPITSLGAPCCYVTASEWQQVLARCNAVSRAGVPPAPLTVRRIESPPLDFVTCLGALWVQDW